MTNPRSAIAVTRNGRGDLWLFDSVTEATRHPLVQYGDAIMAGPADIRRMYNHLDLNSLLEKLDDEILRCSVMQTVSSACDQRAVDAAYDRYQDSIWNLMMNCARTPPTDPGELVNLIVADRDNYNLGLKERTMTDTKAPTTANESKPKAETAAPAEKKFGSFTADQKISLQADKEGRKYGSDNNPKRAGSKSADRFALYKDQMSVAEAIAAGVTVGDLNYDTDKGFIKIA